MALINYTLITFGLRDYSLHVAAMLKESVKVAIFCLAVRNVKVKFT